MQLSAISCNWADNFCGNLRIIAKIISAEEGSAAAGLKGLFALSRHELLPMGESYDALRNVDDVFQDRSPSMLLRDIATSPACLKPDGLKSCK